MPSISVVIGSLKEVECWTTGHCLTIVLSNDWTVYQVNFPVVRQLKRLSCLSVLTTTTATWHTESLCLSFCSLHCNFSLEQTFLSLRKSTSKKVFSITACSSLVKGMDMDIDYLINKSSRVNLKQKERSAV